MKSVSSSVSLRDMKTEVPPFAQHSAGKEARGSIPEGTETLLSHPSAGRAIHVVFALA